MDRRQKWMESMKAKLNTDEEGVREFMRASGAKAKRSSKGGFAYLKEHDPEYLADISSYAGRRPRTYKPKA